MTELPERIPVRVVAEAPAPQDGVVIVTLPPPLHAHAPGQACIACAAHGDVRVLLHDLLVQVERRDIEPFTGVVVIAPDVAATIDRLTPGRQPATALRDHVVARRFFVSA